MLLVASIVLPIVIFAVASAIAYRQHFVDARDRLERDLGRITEHALKVFETFELSAIYLDELIAGVSDEKLRQNEKEYSNRLGTLTRSMPQLRDLWVIDANGFPVVAGTVYAMARIDLSDREYFRVHKNNEVKGLHISEVLSARVRDPNVKFFAVSRRREADGKFAGVTIVSIAPEYFTEYYSRLSSEGQSAFALLRADGVVLARYPEPAGAPTRLAADSAFRRSIQARPDRGTFTNVAGYDGVERTFAYRKLPRHPVYVLSSFSTQSVQRQWATDMGKHLIFGIPATAMMFALGLVALRRSKHLHEEEARRQATEMALRQAQKMEAVGRLSGGIAHDFNNMLTVILGNIDIALRRIGDGNADTSRLTRLLDAARQASERAATLVQRLLAFSRQHPMEVKSVDINRLVQGMSELLRRTIGESIVTETVLGGGLWKVAIDPNQLENAILNLAVNARDAMPDGGRLTIETANSYLDEHYVAAHGGEIAPGQYVMLALSDSGTGMARDVIDRAFEPFFTTKPAGLGTGLGLSMVYGFAKQSGGHIKIYSEVGEGTAIKMYFPRINEQRDIPAWSGDETKPARRAPAGRSTETILLVEDEEEVRQFAAEVLREEGYKIHAAADAASALQILDAQPGINLLFTDVVLPGGMNGRQLADEVQKRRPGLKVLYATGYTRNAIIHHGRLDADVELLTKPFTADALARKVRVILDGKPSAAPTT